MKDKIIMVLVTLSIYLIGFLLCTASGIFIYIILHNFT